MAGAGTISYLPEDLVTEILLRLPTGSTIARFRCVCKSWRDFLSDPDSIHTILSFPNLPCVDKESLRILVTGFEENFDETSVIDRIPYSLHSYETLCPEKTASHELPLGRTPNWDGFALYGCCDGIFCITASYLCEEGVSEVLLWNPTTSEIKFLPLFPVPPRSGHLAVGVDIVGFGFDPQNDDYRVVQRVEFVHDDELGEDEEEGDEVTLPLVYSGVYSLKNDSWKTVTVNPDDSIYRHWVDGSEITHVHQQRDTPRNEKCYWFHGEIPGVCGILSFDISKEVFEYVVFDVDRGFANRKRACSGGEDTGKSSTISGGEKLHRWGSKGSGFMSKGTIMAAFCDMDGGNLHEIWGLLKFGVAESWTRLVTVRTREPMICVEVWKGGTYIYSTDRNLGGEEGRQGDGVFVLDPAAGETVGHLRLEIQAAWTRFEAYVFRPTRVPLSRRVSTVSLSSD